MRSRLCRPALIVLMLFCTAGCGATASATRSTAATNLVSVGAGLFGPAGLRATVYATGLRTASAFAFDGEDRLWVATADYTDRSKDGVYLVDKSGATPLEVISGLHTPLGLLWYGGSLYVSSHARVDAYTGFNGNAFTAHRSILRLPSGIGESNTIVLAPDGRMLMGISSPCDHCTPSNAMSAAIISFRPDGSGIEVYASRIRAPVGLAFYPGTSDLLVTMNQRDDLGARTPGDWLAEVKQGQSWGFPTCYGQTATACAAAPRPLAVLDKHAAVSDVAVVTGQLGAAVGTEALVAEWSDGVVKGVSLSRTSAGYTGSAAPFLLGLQRPVAVALGVDDAVFVGDWGSGKIYRIARG